MKIKYLLPIIGILFSNTYLRAFELSDKKTYDIIAKANKPGMGTTGYDIVKSNLTAQEACDYSEKPDSPTHYAIAKHKTFEELCGGKNKITCTYNGKNCLSKK